MEIAQPHQLNNDRMDVVFTPSAKAEFDLEKPSVFSTALSSFPVISVAKREGRMRRPVHINLYGYNWHAFGPQETDSNKLTDVANPINRRISCQAQNLEYRLKPGLFNDIVNIAFQYNTETMLPLDAVELLNPRKVKQTEKYPTISKRREYIKNRNGQRLPPFPVSFVQVKWHDLNEPTWETASDLKRLLGEKYQFNIERRIYGVALYHAQRIELLMNRNLVNAKVDPRHETHELRKLVTMLPPAHSAGQETGGLTSRIGATSMIDSCRRDLHGGLSEHIKNENVATYGKPPDLLLVTKSTALALIAKPVTIMDLPQEIVEIIFSYILDPPYSGNIIPSPATLRLWRNACSRLPPEIMDLVHEHVLTPACLDDMIPDYVSLRSSYIALSPWRTTCRHFWDLSCYQIWKSVVLPACPDVGISLEQLYQRWGKIRSIGTPKYLEKLRLLEWEVAEGGNTAVLPHMPVLKDLRIRFPTDTWIVRTALLDFQLQPQLKALRLYGRTSDPELMVIMHGRLFVNKSESLQYLWISCLRFGASMGDVLSQNSHALTRLELVACVYPPIHNSDNIGAELPALQHLGIVVNHAREYCTFDKLKYPSSAVVSVERQRKS